MAQVGFVAIDRKSLEDSGVLEIHHYKPLDGDPNVDLAYEFHQEILADPEFAQFVKDEGISLMVLPTVGMMPQAMDIIRDQTIQIKRLEIELKLVKEGKLSELMEKHDEPKSSIILPGASEIPITAQAMLKTICKP